MKIIVDKLPSNPARCPYSKWHPYPPIVESPGYYMCKSGSYEAHCNLNTNSSECNLLKKCTSR